MSRNTQKYTILYNLVFNKRFYPGFDRRGRFSFRHIVDFIVTFHIRRRRNPIVYAPEIRKWHHDLCRLAGTVF